MNKLGVQDDNTIINANIETYPIYDTKEEASKYIFPNINEDEGWLENTENFNTKESIGWINHDNHIKIIKIGFILMIIFSILTIISLLMILYYKKESYIYLPF